MNYFISVIAGIGMVASVLGIIALFAWLSIKFNFNLAAVLAGSAGVIALLVMAFIITVSLSK